jgi:hypothetical protein
MNIEDNTEKDPGVYHVSGTERADFEYSSLKSGLIQIITQNYCTSKLFEEIDIVNFSNELKEVLNENLKFETKVSDCISINEAITGKITFENNGKQEYIAFEILTIGEKFSNQ